MAEQRVVKVRGSAREQRCAQGCGRDGWVWAYDGSDPAEMVDAAGRRYSGDTDRYRPVCSTCRAAEVGIRNGSTTPLVSLVPGSSPIPSSGSEREHVSRARAMRLVRSTRGLAQEHLCANGCGQPGFTWVHDGSDPAPYSSPAGTYSADPDRYEPLCRSCIGRRHHSKHTRTSSGPRPPGAWVGSMQDWVAAMDLEAPSEQPLQE